MKIFAIADLHLSGSPPYKPMEKFGQHWQDHWQKICVDWQQRVSADDVVLIGGDISWAMRWEQAWPDLTAIMALPGRKILIRGNHDYWWQTHAKMTKAANGELCFLQNNFFAAENWGICGTRGWIIPGHNEFKQSDQSIYLRELVRLQLSLDAATQAGYQQLIVILHYPPTDSSFRSTGFTELLAKYKVKICVYGHLHGDAAVEAPQGSLNDQTLLYLTACDATNFKLQQII